MSLEVEEQHRLLSALNANTEPWAIVLCELADWGANQDADRTQHLLSTLGRDRALVAVELLADRWSDETLRRFLPPVWSAAEFPGISMSKTRAVELWKRVGYTVDGIPADRPQAGTVTLYRAAPEARIWGLSWTREAVVAESFLRFGGRGSLAPRVWVAEFPTSRLLSAIHDRNEEEYVVNTTGTGRWRRSVRSLKGP